ncbi:thiosulfate oxidation carrier protein SoxY [Marinobacterium aestuariivivens]|uniref:Thiosulfate oxidation carrier protein SoxY n=1 Tax=Marinobacterium aestuariivivens TaxID=1698799 RepID=A0ABW2A2M9_9GAMM
MQRRELIRRLAMAVTALALMPLRSLANWNSGAFASQLPEEALKAAFGRSDTLPAVEIELKVPTTAYRGALVPVMVSARLPRVTRMALLVHGNPQPLAALYEFGPRALPDMATRIRLLGSSEVSVVVESNGTLFRNSQPVRVLLEGCSGEPAQEMPS